MLNMRPEQIDELCHFAVWADREARSDLALKYITSENDYTSNFTGALRRIINSNSKTGLKARSQKLGAREEQKHGCDAAIAVISNNYIKLAYFEAKWPRLSVAKKRPWDIVPKKTGVSHFSTQLQRQNTTLSSAVAKFEMFYCELPFRKQLQAHPALLNPDTSSCVWFSDAIAHDKLRANQAHAWTDADLISLISSCKQKLNIEDILREVCICNQGTAMRFNRSINKIAADLSLKCSVLVVTAGNLDVDSDMPFTA